MRCRRLGSAAARPSAGRRGLQSRSSATREPCRTSGNRMPPRRARSPGRSVMEEILQIDEPRRDAAIPRERHAKRQLNEGLGSRERHRVVEGPRAPPRRRGPAAPAIESPRAPGRCRPTAAGRHAERRGSSCFRIAALRGPGRADGRPCRDLGGFRVGARAAIDHRAASVNNARQF